MELQQVLNMLQNVSGPNGSGEYTAKCPAHQDRTASLTLTAKQSAKDGKTKIYLCCHAGCTTAAVMGALGITAQDLIVNPDPAGKPGGRTSGKRSGTGAGGRKGSGAPDARRPGTAGTSAAGRTPIPSRNASGNLPITDNGRATCCSQSRSGDRRGRDG